MDATLVKADVRTITITAGATHNIDVVVYKMDSDYSWEELHNTTILATASEDYTYTSDGVYKFFITENHVDTEVSDINYQDFMDYFATPITNIIACACSDECAESDLYDFSSSVFLGITYFGYEYFNLLDITSIIAADLTSLQKINDAIGRTTRYITNVSTT